MNLGSLLRSLQSLLSDFWSRRSETTTVPQLRQGVLGISSRAGEPVADQILPPQSHQSWWGRVLDLRTRFGSITVRVAVFWSGLKSQWQQLCGKHSLNFRDARKSLESLVLDFWSKRSETITVPQLRKGVLGITSQTSKSARANSWKQKLGEGQAATNFTVLADPAPRHRAFAASFVVQCVGVVLLITVPMLLPQRLDPFHRYDVVPLVALPTTLPLAPPKILAKVHPPTERFERPKLPKLIAPPKKVFEEAKFDAVRPPRPRPAVQTGGLAAVSFATPTVYKRVAQVQTEPVPVHRWTPVRWSLDLAGQSIATSSSFLTRAARRRTASPASWPA